MDGWLERAALWVALVGALVGCGATTPERMSFASAELAKDRPAPQRVVVEDLAPRCEPGGFQRALAGSAHGPTLPIRLVVHHAMGASFRSRSVALGIDGVEVCRVETAGDDPADTTRVYLLSGPARRGEREISVRWVFGGHGEGVFSYMQGYTFEVASRSRLALSGPTCVEIVAYEKGGPTTPLEERPALRFAADPGCQAVSAYTGASATPF